MKQFVLKLGLRIFVAAGLIALLHACLEPFTATVGEDGNRLLVVDGLISNEDAVHRVRLSRSVANINQEVIAESGAEVSIEDDLGNITYLTETEAGIYETTANSFQGIPGRSYSLHIETSDRNIYKSAPTLMLPPSEIDSIYYVPGNHPDSAARLGYTGLNLFVSGNINESEVNYVRWAYEEDWKFQVPFGYNEVPNPDGGWDTYEPKKYCFKSEKSSSIMIQAFSNQAEKQINSKDLFFIDSENTDKLYLRYCVNVKQYSISQEEYEFWRKMEQSNQDDNNIFGTQPFTITGNVKNTDFPEENVLGYFSVAGCTSQRMYIDYSEIRHLRMPIKDYYTTCSYDSLMFDDLGMEAYEVYERYILNEADAELAFAIIPQTGFSVTPIGLAVSTPKCCDCTLQGEIEPPYFWEDNE